MNKYRTEIDGEEVTKFSDDRFEVDGISYDRRNRFSPEAFGSQYIRLMFTAIDDGVRCHYCREGFTHPAESVSWWDNFRLACESDMKAFKVEWDSEIVF